MDLFIYLIWLIAKLLMSFPPRPQHPTTTFQMDAPGHLLSLKVMRVSVSYLTKTY